MEVTMSKICDSNSDEEEDAMKNTDQDKVLNNDSDSERPVNNHLNNIYGMYRHGLKSGFNCGLYTGLFVGFSLGVLSSSAIKDVIKKIKIPQISQ